MIDSKRTLLCASAAVLGLCLAPVHAETAPAAPAEAAPVAPAPAPAAAPAAPADPRAAMESRFEEAMAERNKRYEELRKRAEEVGLELPETPPWARSDMPQPPAMPEGMAAPAAPAMERPEPMSREEFEAMRLKRWEAMRARAAEMGRELPETPPWVAAEERRKEMMEKYEAYRATIEAMTDEQKEAIAALFGNRAQPAKMRPRHRGMMPYGMGPDMPPPMPMQGGAAPAAPAPAQQPEAKPAE